MGRIAPLLCLLSVAAASRHHVVGVRPQGELTLDAEDDAHGRHLQQTSQNRALCPDDAAAGGAMSGVRTLTSEQGLNAIQLGGPDGYAAFLFCKWRISPGQPRVGVRERARVDLPRRLRRLVDLDARRRLLDQRRGP